MLVLRGGDLVDASARHCKSVVLARTSYNIVGIINNTILPRMLSPLAWNCNENASLFWGASCFLCTIWCFFRLPEPRGRTYAELEVFKSELIVVVVS